MSIKVWSSKKTYMQADDLAGKVYGVNTGLASLDDPDSGGTGRGILIETQKAKVQAYFFDTTTTQII